MSDPLSRTQPVFSFHTALAIQVGVEAAVLYEFVQAMSRLQGTANDATVAAAEDQWLAWTPFLSPAGFMTALDTLCAADLLTCTEDRAAGTLTLTVPAASAQEAAPVAEPPATVSTSGTNSASAARFAHASSGKASNRHHTRQRLDHSAQSAQATTDDDWAEYDMPPPMPTIKPLLTDHTTVLDSYQQPRPRYSDEPLYAMQQSAPSAAASGGADPSATPSNNAPGGAPENTYMHLEWQPSADCTQMIRNKGIEIAFALAQRESFVLYYRDSGQRNMSWDTKFFNWVTRRWQYHLNDQNQDSQAHAQQPQSDESTARQRKQKLRAKLRDIGDLDW